MSKKLVLLLTVLAAIGFGCGRGTTYKTKDGEVTVNKKGGEVTYEAKSKEGNVKVTANQAGVALPDNFPKDVPIYKGAVPEFAATQGKVMIVHLRLSASQTDAAKYYQDQLKSEGWSIESTMNMGESSMVMAKKGTRTCSVVVTKDGNQTKAQISVAEEK